MSPVFYLQLHLLLGAKESRMGTSSAPEDQEEMQRSRGWGVPNIIAALHGVRCILHLAVTRDDLVRDPRRPFLKVSNTSRKVE